MARRTKKSVKISDIFKWQYLAGGQERNHFHREMRNGAWLSTVLHRLNGTELSWEEFGDNLCLTYWLMPQGIPTTCDGCGKKFLIEDALS